MARLFKVGDERAGRSLLHLLPRRTTHREVRGDEADDLAGAVLGGEPLEHRIGVGANRTDSGPTSASTPAPSQTRKPRAPRSATNDASVSVSSRWSA